MAWRMPGAGQGTNRLTGKSTTPECARHRRRDGAPRPDAHRVEGLTSATELRLAAAVRAQFAFEQSDCVNGACHLRGA